MYESSCFVWFIGVIIYELSLHLYFLDLAGPLWLNVCFEYMSSVLTFHSGKLLNSFLYKRREKK